VDSLQDLLGQYSPEQPSEILAVKQYIADEFDAPSSVGLQGEALVITVASAALANALRLKLPALRKVASSYNRIIFRIG
jgi:hypothetical protein